MKLLTITSTLDPASGGTVTFLRHLTAAYSALGHHCDTVTLDDASAPGVSCFPGRVSALGPSWGKYCYNFRLLPWLKSNANEYDAIIVNGIWQFPSFAVWLTSKKLQIPYFIFTHGALDPWFKSTYPLKHLKKWLYWPWAEYRSLRDAKGVLFSNDMERSLASKSFWLYKANEIVINFGIEAPNVKGELVREIFFEKFPQLKNNRFILYLGRIHPKKGCDLLIRAFAQIVDKHEQGLRLVIAGPDQENAQESLKELASLLGVDKHITWPGMLTGDLKWGAYFAADVFILPSHSENFGMVVAESLSCGLPVLITNKVNIWPEIACEQAGFVDSDTTEGIIFILQKWLTMNLSDKQKMKLNAKRCFVERFEIGTVAQKNIEILETLIK